MGALLFETEEAGFKTVLVKLHDKLEQAGVSESGTTRVTISIDGKTKQELEFNLRNIEELKDILKLNLD